MLAKDPDEQVEALAQLFDGSVDANATPVENYKATRMARAIDVGNPL